jgi:aspartate racemase
MASPRIIGIVGGVGPYAGLDLQKKILDQTVATCDQEHLPIVHISFPRTIEDRSRFLLGQAQVNPSAAIVGVIRHLASVGASIVGIPCNTAHAPPIFDAIQTELDREGLDLKLLHMLDEVASFVRDQLPTHFRIGVLCTTGTFKTHVYSQALKRRGIQAVLPNDRIQASVHRAIYDTAYGIKAMGSPVSRRCRETILTAVDYLVSQGVRALILGCTELPLAIPEKRLGDVVCIDPTLILARALIREAAAERLKPLEINE